VLDFSGSPMFQTPTTSSGFGMTCQPSHSHQADADGRTQGNSVSEWCLKIVVLGPDFSSLPCLSLCVLLRD
jgi:hypothetical protein